MSAILCPLQEYAQNKEEAMGSFDNREPKSGTKDQKGKAKQLQSKKCKFIKKKSVPSIS